MKFFFHIIRFLWCCSVIPVRWQSRFSHSKRAEIKWKNIFKKKYQNSDECRKKCWKSSSGSRARGFNYSTTRSLKSLATLIHFSLDYTWNWIIRKRDRRHFHKYGEHLELFFLQYILATALWSLIVIVCLVNIVVWKKVYKNWTSIWCSKFRFTL